MDEITCRIVHPKTLSYQSMIEKSIHKEKITKIFEPNHFVPVKFYRWKPGDINENEKCLKNEAKDAQVCLTEVSPQGGEENASSSFPKYHITVFITAVKTDKESDKEETLTSKTQFLSFLIDKDYMVNPSYVEITESMGCPYHVTLIVDK